MIEKYTVTGSGSDRFRTLRVLSRYVRALGIGFVALLLAGIVSIEPSQAYRVVPLTIELEPSGRGSQGQFRVINDTPSPVALQVTIQKRETAPDGSDVLTPTDDGQFVLFPPQMVLRPGQSQAVRVQWRGDAAPTSELAFRIITEQLPINLQRERQGGAQVTLLLRYEGTLYVSPPNAAPNIAVESAEPSTNDAGEQRLSVTVNNQGTRHALMGNLKLTVTAGGQSVTMSPEQLEGMNGANILAGATRRFSVAWPDGIPVGPVQVGLEFEPL
jgi:fimbrial chaperone protein